MPRANLLFLQRDELNLSCRGVQLQRWPPAVQVTFRIDLSRAIIAAFGLNANAGQVTVDCVLSVGDVDARMNADLQVRRKIHDDVTNSGIERGVAELPVHGHKLSGNSSSAGLRAHTVADLEAMDAAAAGLCLDGAAATGEANAPAAGLNIHSAPDAANLDIATAC